MRRETLAMLAAALAEELERATGEAGSPRGGDGRSVAERASIGPWCRRDEARAWFGIGPHHLKQLVVEGKVIAKKFDRANPKSNIIFKTADIEKAIEEMPDWKFQKVFGGGAGAEGAEA